MARLTWVGTPGDYTDEITQYGITFKRGEAVTVDDDHDKLEKLKNNPTFATKPDDVKEAHEADEAARKRFLLDELDKLGVDADGRNSLATLEKKHDEALLAKAKAE